MLRATELLHGLDVIHMRGGIRITMKYKTWCKNERVVSLVRSQEKEDKILQAITPKDGHAKRLPRQRICPFQQRLHSSS